MNDDPVKYAEHLERLRKVILAAGYGHENIIDLASLVSLPATMENRE